MHVHHRQSIEDVGLDQPSEGHDHAQLGTGVDDLVDLVGDRESQLLGRGLDRTREQRAAPSSSFVGAGDDQPDVMPIGDQGPQGRDRHRRRPEERKFRQRASARDGRFAAQGRARTPLRRAGPA